VESALARGLAQTSYTITGGTTVKLADRREREASGGRSLWVWLKEN
jgi:hypothetical protein